MIQNSITITPERIKKFNIFLESANTEQMTHLITFYENELKYLVKQKSVLSYLYSPYLKKLVQIIEVKARDPNVLQYFPQIEKIGLQIVGALHPKCLEQQTQQNNKQGLLDSSFQDDEEKQEKPKKEKQQNKPQIKESKDKIMNRISFEQQNKSNNNPLLSCLGCTQFFYQGKNFVTKQIRKTDFVVLPTIKKIKMYEQEIVSSVCALMNNRGGVILFGCYKQKQKFIAKGEIISENAKESILQQILQIFQTFHPKITFSANANLSYVPIAYPSDSSDSEQKQYKEGSFVTRLKIWNNTPEQLYFYTKGNNYYLSQGTTVEGNQFQIKDLKFKQILRLLKKRFKEYYIPMDWTKQAELMRNTRSHWFSDHQCLEPHIGIKIIVQKKEDSQGENPYVYESKYSYVSAVSLNKIPLSKVINFLVGHKITNFKFFSSFKPNLVPNNQIHLLFHDTSPYKLQQILTKLQQGNSKPSMLFLDHSIKIGQNLSQENFQKICQFFRQLNEEEQLKYYRIIDEEEEEKEEEGIIECGSKVSVFFLYMKLKKEGISGTKLIRLDQNRRDKIKMIYHKPRH